ncbi:MAG: class I SAM-dependent methyltransferase, partial [Pseudomonadota bacterium]
AARMALQTVLGVKPQGFFAPYRYADGVAPPERYPALERLFALGRDDYQALLDRIDALQDRLGRIAGQSAPAPRWGQDWFPGLDAAAAYALVATRTPARIVEVGSGHSTRFIARAIQDAEIACEQICIDPAPRATLEGLPVDWRRELLSEAAHGDLFESLEAGDMAVFDSSHLLFPGTDVDIILNRLLPRLAEGVLVHIHDVFLPDPYPESWAWRGYNEQNALSPLILGGAFKPVFASRYVRTRMGAEADAALRSEQRPGPGAFETSLWLEAG